VAARSMQMREKRADRAVLATFCLFEENGNLMIFFGQLAHAMPANLVICTCTLILTTSAGQRPSPSASVSAYARR